MVTAFTVGHWSVSRTVESCYINYRSPPSNLIELATSKLGDEYPPEFYSQIVQLFSKDGDAVLEVGSGTKAGKCPSFLVQFSQNTPRLGLYSFLLLREGLKLASPEK